MLSIGRQGQVYIVTEVTFGTTPALASADALRHRNVMLDYDNFNRVKIAEKQQTPWSTIGTRGNRRKSASWSLDAILHPAGTLNTLPEADEIFKAVAGTINNITLSTTVASAPTVGGATLTSSTGLTVGQGILITSPDGKKRVRRILTLPGANAVTWAPDLPAGQAPIVGAAVKGIITYRLTATNTTSLSIAHYLKKTDGTAGRKRVVRGAVVDSFSLKFDANDEPSFSASGPAKDGAAAPAQPGAFTTVGGQPPSGIVGDMAISGTALKFLSLDVTMRAGMSLRNEDYGTDSASEAYRGGEGSIELAIKCRTEDDDFFYSLAEAGTNVAVFKQTGYIEGNIIAIAAPQVEFKLPGQDDPDDVVSSSYRGVALESADGMNDSFYLYLA